MKRIAVYCGAATGNSEVYIKATKDLASWLVKNNIELVYGGGGVGLMGILSDTVLAQGGKVHGVTTKQLVARGAESPKLKELSDLTVTDNMSARKAEMMNISNGCIALPGGVGTLEEITQAFSWARLGDNPNPCVFYNVNGYYDLLSQMFDKMTSEGFLSAEDRQKVLFSDSLTEIQTFMTHYLPPKARQY
ncbi:TIGR00730 family Rossman fold protein [Lentilactobacillus otakiensis]|uniref:LOG family protein n=1 Tax=Lentilactobacillus otakiensis TaxID=481720 RepID=UPI003D1799A8